MGKGDNTVKDHLQVHITCLFENEKENYHKHLKQKEHTIAITCNLKVMMVISTKNYQ